MNKLAAFDYIAFVLVLIGAINWGLVGLFRFDLVATILGDMTIPARVVYSVVGISAIYVLILLGRLRKAD
jgi:uncharacterized membrane protein YuzA (DUF378 family)